MVMFVLQVTHLHLDKAVVLELLKVVVDQSVDVFYAALLVRQHTELLLLLSRGAKPLHTDKPKQSQERQSCKISSNRSHMNSTTTYPDLVVLLLKLSFDLQRLLSIFK